MMPMPGSTQTAHRHPTVLAHQRARRANPHLRLADRITTFVGSMSFVYIHGLAIAGWMLLVESNPWPKLTLMVSMEAIFLSSFVLIGQNRQAAFQRDKADHDFLEQEGELKLNTELTRAVHKLTREIHDRLGAEESHRDDDDAGTLPSATTEGSSQVVDPLVGDLPRDEVAAVVVGGGALAAGPVDAVVHRRCRAVGGHHGGI
jgi:uncharacterized membrane protein